MSWPLITALIIAASIISAVVFYMVGYEPVNFKLSKIKIDLGDGSKGSVKTGKSGSPMLTILHLSDFHMRNNLKGRKMYRFVSGLKDIKVDFIFITGDLIDRDISIRNLGRMLAPLKARYGKYAVLGVHDHYDKAFYEFAKNMFRRKRKYRKGNNISLLVERLENAGVEVLRNENRIVQINTGGIGSVEILGVGDPVIRKDNIKKAMEGLSPGDNFKTLKKSDFKTSYKNIFSLKQEKVHEINKNGKIRLALMHTPDPRSIIELVRSDVDIILSGHTHGGQVRLPFIGALISGCKLKARFAGGLFYFKKFILYVTRGLGEGKYSQFRFYCPPEASLIRIYWKTPASSI